MPTRPTAKSQRPTPDVAPFEGWRKKFFARTDVKMKRAKLEAILAHALTAIGADVDQQSLPYLNH
jgi:hypothetical protein